MLWVLLLQHGRMLVLVPLLGAADGSWMVVDGSSATLWHSMIATLWHSMIATLWHSRTSSTTAIAASAMMKNRSVQLCVHNPVCHLVIAKNRSVQLCVPKPISVIAVHSHVVVLTITLVPWSMCSCPASQ
jgi:hypothetical protein